MKNIIKKILRESDFEWVDEIEYDDELTLTQLKIRFDKLPKEFATKHIVSNFRDLSMVGGSVKLTVSSWEDFSELFEDSDGGYGYVNRYLAKAVLAEDDYWEPYYDVVGNWNSEVWDAITDNEELLEYIKRYIKKWYVVPNEYNPNQLDLFTGDTPKERDIFEIDGRVLDEDFFNEIIVDDVYLGNLIDEDPIFEDLKDELRWAYESVYNSVARDSVWNAVYDAITNIFGKGEWTQFENSKGVTEHVLEFDVTDLVLDSVEKEIDNCIDGCRKYYNADKHYDEEEFDSEEEAFESFCEECLERPFDEYWGFLDFYSYILYEHSEQLNPRYDEYPSHSDIVKYLPDEVYNRI